MHALAAFMLVRILHAHVLRDFLAHAEIYARNSGIFILSRSSYTIILADQILLSVLKGVTVQLPLVAI